MNKTRKQNGSFVEESRLAEHLENERRLKPKHDPEQRTQALMAAIGQCSIAARVQTHEPLTVDFVANRITKGDATLAMTALHALNAVGVLTFELSGDDTLFRLAEQ